MNFKEELNLKTQEIEQLIRRYLPKEEGFASTLARAMNYSMLAGGKRLRPLMMQEVYRMFGGTQRVIEPFMVAMEMILFLLWTTMSTVVEERRLGRYSERIWE